MKFNELYEELMKDKITKEMREHFKKRTKMHINLVKKYAKKSNIPHNVSFHNFRHYFITSLVKKGWSYDKIAKLTGHSSVGTLAHYDHSVASDIQEDALNALNDM